MEKFQLMSAATDIYHRTIEELQYTFDLPTRVHIRYRVKYITKWLAYRFALPPAQKVGVYKGENLRQGPKDFQSRLNFFRWGREEVRRVEARTDVGGDVVELGVLFYPFGMAKIRKPKAARTRPQRNGFEANGSAGH
jgi:hypothetical protein